MVKVFEHSSLRRKLRNKQGFGIVEVLIAAAVLGFLYTAVLNLHGGNHDALLSIRGRDGATEVAQNLIDSIGAMGIANLSTNLSDKVVYDSETKKWYLAKSDGDTKAPDTIWARRVWTGQPGLVTNTMVVYYAAVVSVSHDTVYMAKNTSRLLRDEEKRDSIPHIYAKQLGVTVKWCFKCPDRRDPTKFNRSIEISGVVR